MKLVVDVFRLINKIFTTLCIVIAIFFTVYCTYQYCKNEDSSVVTFSRYHDQADNLYPGMTLCFRRHHEDGTFPTDIDRDLYYKYFLEGETLFETFGQKRNYLRYLESAQSSGTANDQKSNETKKKRKNKSESFNNNQYSDGEKGNRKNSNRTKRDTLDDLSVKEEEQIANITKILKSLYENNLALDIKNYLLFGLIKDKNVGMYVHEFPKNRSWRLEHWGDRVDQKQNETWRPLFYPSLSDIKKRCWTFEIPYSQGNHIQTLGVMLNKSIFMPMYSGMPFGDRPAYKDFEIRLSYPKQQLTAPTTKSNWGYAPLITHKDYTMKFEIQNMVVLKRRNKLNNKCRETWRENDHHIIEDIIAETGCVMPHWSLNITAPICSGMKIQNTTRLLSNLNGTIEPCQSIEKFMYLYQSSSGLDFYEETLEEAMRFNGTRYDKSGIFHVMVTFQGATFMDITQSRAYDAQSLVGNAGGYVGLFLGVALIQTPSAVRVVFQLIKNLFQMD